ncbi:T9SS type B sorting domain-containing protein [Antarcticibacterium sp. 1MA-6-2]|uniref:T9SS type B sorting domain-containing protein n=1 Tax=Antarcticibacterium sp. 1MA-6-2 TaxID=2908210 RepID=UPI001F2910A0|nr:T9SS type B sorting domain-containing protein [Antarcticibacterium sp. 1MA-6-2]UJH89694.1 T9SS type B sorting domain-containing protein [Antarcticibacterium sp. 1MA-6-2]
MKPGAIYFLFIAFFALGSGALFAQGDRCSTIQPFCAGDELLIFENSSSANNSQTVAERGPDYGCLVTQPYPAWFYLQVREGGNLEFNLRQSQNPDGSGMLYDVDFIVWGPFDPGEEYCSASKLNAQNTIDCSYDPSPVENVRIPSARANQVYVVLITNFSALPGYISLQQVNTGSGGSTDCSIVGSALGPDQRLCGVEEVTLNAENVQATAYEWFVLNERSNQFEVIPGETGPTLTVNTSGEYQVTVTSDVLNAEDSDQVLIEFFDNPVASVPSPVIGCAEGETVTYNLTNATSDMVGGNPGSYSSMFFLTQDDYERSNRIPNPTNFIGVEGQSILGVIVDEESGCRSNPVAIRLEAFSFPEIEFPPVIAFCVDSNGDVVGNVSIGENLGSGYVYSWNVPNDPDGDGVENAVLNLESFPPQNVISLTLEHRESSCQRTFSTEVVVFSPPAAVTVEIEGSDFEGGYRLTATASRSMGDETSYEYRLDNGPWQMDNIFQGVSGGTHTITAREINGCGSTSSAPFRLLGYPRFFTPNNDGYNDKWNIINDGTGFVTKILIFDRYGKLLKEIQPSSSGWDGTYNDALMPADDYWFVVEYRDKNSGVAKDFKGHFSLKR